MAGTDLKRLPRLTAILTRLQTKRVVTASELADRFEVSLRTIYRDIRALEMAGVPVVTEEGKGYTLMEGYRLPPVSFTEEEANALVAANQLVLRSTDASLVASYGRAVEKIISIMDDRSKTRLDLLTDRTQFPALVRKERTSANLSDLQSAITGFRVVRMEYTNAEGVTTPRSVEPFALLSTANWLLIAWCRRRKEFRYFRTDRIQRMEVLEETFTPHDMTLQRFFERYHNAER